MKTLVRREDGRALMSYDFDLFGSDLKRLCLSFNMRQGRKVCLSTVLPKKECESLKFAPPPLSSAVSRLPLCHFRKEVRNIPQPGTNSFRDHCIVSIVIVTYTYFRVNSS